MGKGGREEFRKEGGGREGERVNWGEEEMESERQIEGRDRGEGETGTETPRHREIRTGGREQTAQDRRRPRNNARIILTTRPIRLFGCGSP